MHFIVASEIVIPSPFLAERGIPKDMPRLPDEVVQWDIDRRKPVHQEQRIHAPTPEMPYYPPSDHPERPQDHYDKPYGDWQNNY